MKKNKDIDRLIFENEKLIYYVVKRYKGLDLYEYLVQEGVIGLIKAAQRFDLTKGFAFSTFAIPYIKGEILHYLRDRSQIIKTPRKNASEKLIFCSIEQIKIG